MEKTILVPLDGSATAEVAVSYAEAVAKALGATLRLLTVVQPLLGSTDTEALEEMGQQIADEYLEAAADRCQEGDLQVSSLSVHGDPSDEILAAADEPEVAMTIMATHGRSGLSRWLLGSVADKVMRMSTRPVLLIRPYDPAWQGRHCPQFLFRKTRAREQTALGQNQHE